LPHGNAIKQSKSQITSITFRFRLFEISVPTTKASRHEETISFYKENRERQERAGVEIQKVEKCPSTKQIPLFGFVPDFAAVLLPTA